LKESEPPGNGFLAEVAKDWEKEAFKAEEKGARVAVARFGVVLGKTGGAMAKMIPLFKLFLGGPLGNGKQYFPWIHIQDIVGAILFVLENDHVKGPLNCCAPHSVENKTFAKTLGKILGRPALLPAPYFMVRLLLGEFGGSFYFSQRAVPDRLLKHGFPFKFPRLDDALADIIKIN
jgi:uncharacterized protein (TIGR01777 family)